MHNTYSIKELSEIFGLNYQPMRGNIFKAKLQKYPKTSKYGKYNVYEVGDALFGFDHEQTDEYVNEWKENHING